MNPSILDRILNRIKDRTCLVILGPELLTESHTSINAQLNQRLMEGYGKDLRYYAEDEFINLDKRTRLMLEDDVKDFYENLQPTPLYELLAEIPFPLILNTAPDTTLNRVFDQKNIGFDYDWYHKNKAPQEIVRKHPTLLYNLFGDYHDIDSLVLSFDDMFEYLLAIMGDNELKIKGELHNAKVVLFLGFSFDKWYFKLLLRLLQIRDESFKHSNDIAHPTAKNFFADAFRVDFFEQESAAHIVQQLHQQATARGLIQKPVVEPVQQSELFVSYAWGGESEELVNRLDTALQDQGILLVRDKRDLGFRGLITEFMNRIGKGKGIVVVVGDKYLKSPYCMYELLEIYRNLAFAERIFPIVLADANIFEPLPRLQYLKYWRDKKEELDTAIRDFGADAITVIGDDYKIYKRVFDNFGDVVNILKDINSLTPEMHRSSDFEALIAALKQKI